MKTLRSFLGKIRWKALETFNRRDFHFSGERPVVSFTFDDFPQSALHIGGSILKNYGVCGTYYAAMGLMGQHNGMERYFNIEDLLKLVQDGHELGSHTFSHLSGRSSILQDFQIDALKGMEAVNQFTGNSQPHSFSYPKGHATFRIKGKISPLFSSCRGIIPGVNKSPADLNLLRANSLYSHSFDAGVIERLFKANEKFKGWLIFYTHDISKNPSPFGCRPEEFEQVVKMAINWNFKVLTIGQVYKGGIW